MGDKLYAELDAHLAVSWHFAYRALSFDGVCDVGASRRSSARLGARRFAAVRPLPGGWSSGWLL